MQYSLGTALNYGLVREGGKEEQRGIDSIFINRVRAQSNLNTLNIARKSGVKSSNFGIADNDTGLVTIPSNFEDTMKELEEVETRENIVDTLTKDQNVSKKGRAKLIADDDKFYSSSWFIANPSKKTAESKINFSDSLKNYDGELFETKIYDGTEIKAIPFGDASSGIKSLFRVPKN